MYDNYSMDTLREYFREDIAQLLHDFHGTHYTEIPMDRVNEIDFLGYGWPVLDCDGDLIDVSDLDHRDDGAREIIVLDENGTDWVYRDYSDDTPEFPDGLWISDYHYSPIEICEIMQREVD